MILNECGRELYEGSTIDLQLRKLKSAGKVGVLGDIEPFSPETIIVAAQAATAPFSGRSGRLASTADKRDQPMGEYTGRRRRSISIITVVYASNLYCTGRTTPLDKGDTGCVPLPPTPGVNPYNNRKLCRGGAA